MFCSNYLTAYFYVFTTRTESIRVWHLTGVYVWEHPLSKVCDFTYRCCCYLYAFLYSLLCINYGTYYTSLYLFVIVLYQYLICDRPKRVHMFYFAFYNTTDNWFRSFCLYMLTKNGILRMYIEERIYIKRVYRFLKCRQRETTFFVRFSSHVYVRWTSPPRLLQCLCLPMWWLSTSSVTDSTIYFPYSAS